MPEEEIIMPTRLAVCTIVGDGTDVPDGPGVGSFRPIIQDIANVYGLDTDYIMPDTDGTTGLLLGDHAFCRVSGPNMNPILNDERIVAFPNIDPAISWSSVSSVYRTQLASDLSGAGFETAFMAAADSFGDVLTGIGQQVNAAFQLSNFPL